MNYFFPQRDWIKLKTYYLLDKNNELRQEDYEFKASLEYTVSSKLALVT